MAKLESSLGLRRGLWEWRKAGRRAKESKPAVAAVRPGARSLAGGGGEESGQDQVMSEAVDDGDVEQMLRGYSERSVQLVVV